MRKRSLDEVNTDHHTKRRRIDGPEKVKLFAKKRFYAALNEALHKDQAVEIVDAKSLVFANIKVDSLRGWELLSEAIAANQSIENISGPYQHLTAAALQLIFDALPKNNHIKNVQLSWNPNIQSEWWSKLVRLTNSIEHLTIPALSLTASACKSLSEALIINTSIRKLIMYDNSDVGAKGSLWISEALKLNKTLVHLHLGSCGIDDEGCTYLSEALKTNQTLTTLSLGSNKFAHIGLASLCNALKINTTLENLWLDNNNIQSEGCKLLIDLFNTNTTLKHLSLSSNNITDEDCHFLAEIIKVTKGLGSLEIGFNKYGERGLDIIGNALEINHSLTDVNCDKIMKSSSLQMQRIYHLANNNRKKLKRDMIERMVVALTSIARQQESYQLFPKEIWIAIFTHITYPGLERSFGDIAIKIFNDVSAK